MTPKEFNFALKKKLEEAGYKCRVRIVNSYNYPNCWVQVWQSNFDNDFKLKVFDACGFKRENLLNPDNVSYGNIQTAYISASVTDWCKVFPGLEK